MGLTVLAGGLAFVGTADATELIIDGSFENVTPTSKGSVNTGGTPILRVGRGWSTFSTYLYSTGYSGPQVAGAGANFLRPFNAGADVPSSMTVIQAVSLTNRTTLTPEKIDAGSGRFTMSAWFSTYITQNDYSTLTLDFLDDVGTVIGESITPLGGSNFVSALPQVPSQFGKYRGSKEWGKDERTGTIPAGARRARVTIQSTATSGEADGYVDLVSLDVTDVAPTLGLSLRVMVVLGIGFVVGFTAAFVLWWVVLRKKTRIPKNSAIEARPGVLALSEREQLSRDLHDGSVQSMYALGLGLQRCQKTITKDPVLASELLAHSIRDVDRVISELRQFLLTLNPGLPHRQTLQSVLWEVIGRIRRTTDVKISFNAADDVASTLDARTCIELVNIVREAITNCLRHAQAAEIIVDLKEADHEVCIGIRDDGKGFDVQAQSETHLGLHNMEARAREIGGTCVINSTIGAGTTVVVTVPVREANGAPEQAVENGVSRA